MHSPREFRRQQAAGLTKCFIANRTRPGIRRATSHTFLTNVAIAMEVQLDVRAHAFGYRAKAHLVASVAGIAVVPRSAVDTEDLRHLAVLQLDEPLAVRSRYRSAR